MKLRLIAIQCLLETARQFYDYIDDHIDHFTPTLKIIMEADDESCAILAYEFWCSVGDIEIARLETRSPNLPCRKICEKVYKEILPVIYKHLLVGSQNSEDSWNLCKASSCLLSILSQCCEFNLIQEVINYIGANIGQSSSLNKEAAIMAFGSILETVHRDNMANLVMNSIDTLINFLNDANSSNSLKDTTAWVIEKIAEIYGEEFMKNNDLFERLMNMIFNLLTLSRRKVVCHLANSLHHFSVAFKPQEGQNSNMMSKHMKNCLEILLKLAFTPKSYDADDNVALASFYAIGSLIENSAPDTRVIVSSFFNSLLDAFRSTLNPEFFESTKMRYDYQAYIAASLEPCFVSGYLSISFDGAREILEIIINTFKERKGVYEEGLMAASALALCVGSQFEPLVKEFGSYLIFALNSVTDTSLCKTAIHSTSDLIRSIGTSFSQYLDQIVPIILGILSNTEADKSLKPHSFNVISDLFITCKDSVFNYFDNIMELIGSALEAATFLTDDKEDFETIEYFELLREHILECLTCIFQNVKDMKKEEDFKRYVVPIVRFVNTINQREYNPTTVYFKWIY
jgi:importin subunit beta-1